MAELETRRQRHVLRVVHRPVAAGRRERMVRGGKRRHQEEWLIAVSGGVAGEPRAAFVGDVGGRRKLLRNGGAESPRTDVIVRKRVPVSAQRGGVTPPRFERDIAVYIGL